MNCRFCDQEVLKDRIIFERPHVTVFLSNPRLVPGHTLVVPKRHVERLDELFEVELQELIHTVILFEKKIIALVAKGCDIRQHYRPFLPESDIKVDHLHIHLLPRELYDDLWVQSQKYEAFVPLTDEEAQKFRDIFLI